MFLLRPCLTLFAVSSSSSSRTRRPRTAGRRLPAASSSDVNVADAASTPFEPIRDTCLEDFQRSQEQEEAKGNNNAGATSTSSPLSAFSTIRNGPSSVSGSSSTSVAELNPSQVVYRVCLSPGCVADGAVKTYEQLIALAPPHVAIEPGSCHSLCGNGPVVDAATTTIATTSSATTSSNNNSKRLRKVSGSKVLQLLQEEGVIPELVTGYDLVLKGDQAFAVQQYETSIDFYRQAVDVAFRPAMDSHAAREHLARIAAANGNKGGASVAAPPASSTSSRRGSAGTAGSSSSLSAQQLSTSSLDWLVRARRNTAKSLLQLGQDLEAALLEAQAACNLSRNTCWKSFAVVAECYKIKNNAKSEYETLKALFALSVNEDALDFASKNDRRELQFRMQRLAKDLKS